MKITIGTIVGTGDRAPRLKIECPNGDLMVHGLDLESARDAAFRLDERYGVFYMDAVRAIKIALLETTYSVPEETLEWAAPGATAATLRNAAEVLECLKDARRVLADKGDLIDLGHIDDVITRAELAKWEA